MHFRKHLSPLSGVQSAHNRSPCHCATGIIYLQHAEEIAGETSGLPSAHLKLGMAGLAAYPHSTNTTMICRVTLWAHEQRVKEMRQWLYPCLGIDTSPRTRLVASPPPPPAESLNKTGETQLVALHSGYPKTQGALLTHAQPGSLACNSEEPSGKLWVNVCNRLTLLWRHSLRHRHVACSSRCCAAVQSTRRRSQR